MTEEKSKSAIAKEYHIKYPSLGYADCLKKGMPQKVTSKDFSNARYLLNKKDKKHPSPNDDKKKENIFEDILKGLSGNGKIVRELILENPTITQKEVEKKIGKKLSNNMITYHRGVLRKKGLIEGDLNKPLKNKGLMRKLFIYPAEEITEKEKEIIINAIKKTGDALGAKIDVVDAANYKELWAIEYK